MMSCITERNGYLKERPASHSRGSASECVLLQIWNNSPRARVRAPQFPNDLSRDIETMSAIIVGISVSLATKCPNRVTNGMFMNY
jgi:hypothetical protein